jgi:hypothetical protein
MSNSDLYYEDLARLLELSPRELDVIKALVAIAEDRKVLLNPTVKKSLCEKLGFIRIEGEYKYPSVNVIDQFCQLLRKKGMLERVDKGVFLINDLMFYEEGMGLSITYTFGRKIELITPQYEHLQEGMREDL